MENQTLTFQDVCKYPNATLAADGTIGIISVIYTNGENVCLQLQNGNARKEVYKKISECQLVLRPLSEITDEDAIEVARIINPDFSNSNYKVVHIGTLEEFHKTIKCVVFEIFINHPDVMEWVKSDCIQIDTEAGEFDVIHGIYSEMGTDYEDGITDNVKDVIDFLRSRNYDLDNYIGNKAVKM